MYIYIYIYIHVYLYIVHFHSIQALLRDAKAVIHVFPESSTDAMLTIETTTNDEMNGRYCFKVDTAGVVDTCAGLCVWSCFYPHLKW